MIKILIISPKAPPIGGIATWSNNVLDSINKNDFLLHHYNTSLNLKFSIKSNIFQRLSIGIFSLFFHFHNILKYKFKNKPDLVHICSSGSFGIIRDFLFTILFIKCKRVIHFHFGRIPEIKNTKSLEWYALKLLCKFSSHIIVLDSLSLNELTLSGFANVSKIENPISKTFSDISKDFNVSNKKYNDTNLLFVGHVVEQKGIFELIDAFLKLNSNTKLDIIGPYSESIGNKILSLKSNKINLHGQLDQIRILDFLMNDTVLILPSYTEGFPNVIIEAMALGCPVIATDVGAIPEILNISSTEPCGFCIPIKNSDSLFSILTKLLNNKILLSRIGLNGQIRVLQRYSLNKILIKYYKIWK